MYTLRDSGYREIVNNVAIQPQIVQPTALGIQKLCDHYRKKYAIDMRLVTVTHDLSRNAEAMRFQFLKDHPHTLAHIAEGQMRGLLLYKEQGHAIPVIVKKIQDTFNFFIFDSTSGACYKAYYKVAELFPEATIFLNAGTRQADSTSCIADAVCILKDALRIDLLEHVIAAKIVAIAATPLGERKSALKFASNPVKPLNFQLFKMPELLLKTAQRSAYLEGADLSVIIHAKKNLSLKDYRQQFRINVSLLSKNPEAESQVNSYLFNKSWRFKQLLDALPTEELKAPADLELFEMLPNEILHLVFEQMTSVQRVGVARVSMLWRYLVATLPPPNCQGVSLFGPAQWMNHFKLESIEDIPRLPPDFDAINASDCPFNVGKKVKDTHFWTVIPGHLNGKPLTLNCFKKLINAQLEYIGFYGPELSENFGKKNIDPCWVLMSKQCLNIRDTAAMQKMNAQGYTPPNIALLGMAVPTHFLVTGIPLLKDMSAKCQESTQDSVFYASSDNFRQKPNLDFSRCLKECEWMIFRPGILPQKVFRDNSRVDGQ